MLGIVLGVLTLALESPDDAARQASQRMRAQLMFAGAGAASAIASALAISTATSEASDADDQPSDAGDGPATPALDTQPRDSAVRREDLTHVPSVTDLSDGMEELLAQIEAAQESQRRVIRGIGHDLRSPLSSIVAMAESLEHGELGPLNAEQLRACALLEQTARRLMGHTEILYALSEGRVDPTGGGVAPFDAGAVTQRVVEGFRPVSAAKGIELVVACAQGEIEVIGDEVAFERIVANIVDNAIKFTDKGSVSVEVVASADAVRLVVSDTGIGISEADLSHVTEEYYRAEAAGGREGSGVGLAVVRELVEALGAAYTVESSVGSGTRMTVEFAKA